jgi:hypothetical protein
LVQVLFLGQFHISSSIWMITKLNFRFDYFVHFGELAWRGMENWHFGRSEFLLSSFTTKNCRIS